MATQLDIEQIIHDDRTVAAAIDADRIFGVFKRTLDVPAGWIAVASLRDGDTRVAKSGQSLDGADVSTVLLVSANPFDVEVRVDSAASADKYLLNVKVWFGLRLLESADERDVFRQNVMQSRSHVLTDHVADYLTHAASEAIRHTVAGSNASDFVDGDARARLAGAVTEAIKGPCFTGGLEFLGRVFVEIASEAYKKVRNAQQRAASRLGEHQAQRQLQEALQTAHTDRVEHLETMLARLNALAEKSPDVELPELMRAFDQVQRGQLYQALFAAESERQVTQWLVVAAGNQLLFFDPADCGSPVRRVTIDGPAGALRSVQFAMDSGDAKLLLGAADGVYVLSPDADEPERTYLFADPGAAAGGVNAVAMQDDWIVASHSKRGITAWKKNGGESDSISICEHLTRQADAVRSAQFHGGWFYCAIGRDVVALPANDMQVEPRILTTLTSVIGSMCVTDSHVYAGTADGQVVAFRLDEPSTHQTLHAGSRRAVESIHLIENGPVSRLFYTDTTLAVFSRVIGDSFTCRFEAGGQTLRRVEPAADYVSATTDARDRIILFATKNPDQPSAVIPVSQLTGRSIQDACLVPIVGARA